MHLDLFEQPGQKRVFQQRVKGLQDALAAGNTYILALEGAVPVEGGFPIVMNGKMVGSIGASGGTAPQDGVVAKAGADALK